MVDALTYAYIGDLTKSRDEKGVLHIKGIATDDSLDLDGQRCDPEWLKTAMSDWFKVGNIREMHQMSAIGKAHSMTQQGTGFEIEAAIIDPLAAEKFETGVYSYLSIGIKGARIDTTEKALETAPEGWIIGGKVVEVSGVDIGSNQNAKVAPLELVKTVGDLTYKTEALGEVDKAADGKVDCPTCDGTGKIKAGNVKCPDCNSTGKVTPEQAKELKKAVEPDLEKREFTDDERAAAAKTGAAMPGGGFPVKNVGDLKNAIQAIGRAKDPAAAKAHIKTRATALGKENLIPAGWKSVEGDVNKAKPDEMTHDPADLAAIRTGLVNVLKAELDELATGSDNEIPDLYQLLNSLSTFLCWWSGEADEDETTPPFPEDSGDDTMAYIGLGVSADLIKSATQDDATPEVKDELRTELRKALGLAEIATKADTEALQEAVKGLEATVKTISEMAAPGQPALRGTLEQQNKAAQADELEATVAKYRNTAMTSTDPETARQYAEAADTLQKRAAGLRPQPL